MPCRYSVFFPHHCADDFCRHVFRTFDLNRDGIVDFREYMLALHVITNGTDEERLAWAFRLFDIDNNGVIDNNEVTEIARAILQVVTPAAECLERWELPRCAGCSLRLKDLGEGRQACS